MDQSSVPPLGVVAVHSCSFVRIVLEQLRLRRVVVPLRSADDELRIRAAGVEEIVEPEADHGWLKERYEPFEAPTVAQILFTSGTEGAPKGVELTHAALADVTQRLNEVMRVDESIREYLGIPAYHSFGFGRCRAVAAAGGEVYLPEHGFDPLEIASMLSRGEINAISAVPSLWRMLFDARHLFGTTGRQVRWIEIGSQFMSREEKETLRGIFPCARIVQHYGLTEASRTTFLEIHDVHGEALGSVGRPFGAVEVKLSAAGRIMIRGPHVTQRVLTEGEAVDPRDAEGWLTTNDLGAVRDGFVYFEGRADDVINCGGVKLAPELFEQRLREQHPGNADFAVCRTPDPLRGDGILLAVGPEIGDRTGDVLYSALIREAEAQGIQARGAITIFRCSALPRTASGKVQRRLITEAHVQARTETSASEPPAAKTTTEPEADAGAPRSPREAKERELAALWEQVLGVSPIQVDETFYDLGGDSLSAITVVMRMTRAGIAPELCRQIFQGATIRDLARAAVPDEAVAAPGHATAAGADSELAALQDPRPAASASVGVATPHRGFTTSLMVHAVRGLLVAVMVLGHWSEGFFARVPRIFSAVEPLVAPVFAFGTPGFAIVFGIGFGFLHLPNFRAHPRRVVQSCRAGVVLVGGGVLSVVAMHVIAALLQGVPVTTQQVVLGFYSALFFYVLALSTLPLWFRIITWLGGRGAAEASSGERDGTPSSRTMLVLLDLCAASFATSMLLRWGLEDRPLAGVAELARLLLVAKYSYFTMMGGVFAGLALGVYVKRSGETPTAPRTLYRVGAAAVVSALLVAAGFGELHLVVTWPSELTYWKWLLYAGVVTLLVGGLLGLMRDYASLGARTRTTINLLGTIGQLALPFYVLHQVMIPLKHVLTALGLPSMMALWSVLTLFVAGGWMMVRRMYRLFHGSTVLPGNAEADLASRR